MGIGTSTASRLRRSSLRHRHQVTAAARSHRKLERKLPRPDKLVSNYESKVNADFQQVRQIVVDRRIADIATRRIHGFTTRFYTSQF